GGRPLVVGHVVARLPAGAVGRGRIPGAFHRNRGRLVAKSRPADQFAERGQRRAPRVGVAGATASPPQPAGTTWQRPQTAKLQGRTAVRPVRCNRTEPVLRSATSPGTLHAPG